jgi:hypothetical protein
MPPDAVKEHVFRSEGKILVLVNNLAGLRRSFAELICMASP